MAANANPWGASPTVETTDSDWLNSDSAKEVEPSFDWLNPFEQTQIPFDRWVENGIDWIVEHFRGVFQAIKIPIDTTLSGMESFFQAIPATIFIVLMALFAWQIAGKKAAFGTFISLALIGFIGAWSEMMVTLSLVFTSVIFCIVIGLPLGIWIARSYRASSVVRPILDAMQTTPAFVYLVPVVMLFGIGNVPGVVVTIIFALPPLIRLTNLGIRQVPKDLIEVSQSFGASAWQMLIRVQLPVAMPTIMAGINQTLMLSLSMVVFASMIAVGGLGQMVLRGIGRLDMGLAAVGGLGIVLLAVVLDRLTQALGTQELGIKARGQKWYEKGPIGLVYTITCKRRKNG
ncbi:MAG: glycine betaine/L-proline ABC transporter permease ProW [Sulfurospirillaceae bacterium]|nr:glycine betaine/L-proline ABC transporter permease ProW [Sulfurospirillaceae bacterium]